ncbi:MAG: zf-HC2 domain-containing protein [Acidobacteriota bacterium]|nr:zf-HC2 domain-containing protein [Acidobacteriota bacterium]
MKNRNEMNSQSECGYKEELVTYLYDDVTAIERASFENHLKECDPCSAELNAFGRVRDELNTWQVGFAPRTEWVLPRGKVGVLRELFGLFPAWTRSLAIAGVAAAAILLALSVIGTRISFNQGDFTVNFGSVAATEKGGYVAVAVASQQQIESLVKNAVAAESEKIQQDYQSQFINFRQQLDTEYKARLQAVSAEHQAKLEATKASLRYEIKKSSLQRGSIRSFFAMDDDRQDPWSDVR